jgi:ATP-dependent Clp protease ATP-binding subunit ClpC
MIIQKHYRKCIKENFAPEFLNRIDDVIVFNAEKHDIDLIIEIELKNYLLAWRIGYQLNLSDKAKHLFEKGFDKQFGARPLKKRFKYVEDTLAEKS